MNFKASQNGLIWVIVISTFLAIVLGSCAKQEAIKTPAVIVGIGKSDACKNSAAVVIRDQTGVIYSFGCDTDLAKALSSSRQVGDTIQ